MRVGKPTHSDMGKYSVSNAGFRAVPEQFQFRTAIFFKRLTRRDRYNCFKMLSEHFQSIFRANLKLGFFRMEAESERFWRHFIENSEQFQSSFRAVSEQFQRGIRACSEGESEQFWNHSKDKFQTKSPIFSEQFQNNFRAISEQFSNQLSQ